VSADVIERARALFSRYEEEVRSLVPEGSAIFDAHTHVGTDIDGFVGPVDELLETLRRAGISRAFTFCLDEPLRRAGAGRASLLDRAA
jgi:hypothetical protein